MNENSTIRSRLKTAFTLPNFKSSWRGMNKSQKVSLVSLMSLILVMPLFMLAMLTQTSIRPRAEEPVTPPDPILLGDKDLQTKEWYHLWPDTKVTTTIPGGPGPVYRAKTTLAFGGPALENYQRLYGFKQNTELPYAPDSFEFTNNGTLWATFTATVDLLDSNCIDLHSRNTKAKQSYIATLCYKNTFVQPGESGTAYSPAANPFITYDYSGTSATTVQFFSTAFDKYEVKSPGNENGPHQTRVNWLIIDPDASSLSDFVDVNYHIQGITGGLTNDQYAQLCTNPTDPQKFIKQTPVGSHPKPEGGNSIPVTAASGACGYIYTQSSLLPFFLSLYMQGGLPVPPMSTPPPGSPTPTPGTERNSRPTFTTTTLPNGQVGVPYSTGITATDADANEALSMTHTALPPGLTWGPCSLTSGQPPTTMQCIIQGTPTQTGRTTLNVTVADDEGASSSKNFNLTIQ